MVPIFANRKRKKIIEQIGTEAEFAWEKDAKGIGLKSSLTEYAALIRGLNVNRISKRIILVKSKSGIQHSFIHMNGDRSSRVGMHLCDRKHDSREILKQKGISVVESKLFSNKNYEHAIKYVEKIGFPVVIKPISLSRSRGITTNIQSFNDFEKAWEKAFSAYRKNRATKNVIIERHFNGEDYRFYVVGDKLISATHRKRANVLGDGSSNVLELIKRKNQERTQNPYLSKHLIPEDISLLDALTDQNINLEYIPDEREEVVLSQESNVSAGGDNIDVTNIAHQGFKDIAIKTVKAIPGIEYGGMDFLAKDITAKPTKSNHIVSEVEFSPAPLAHFPYSGESRDMAGSVIDHYFTK